MTATKWTMTNGIITMTVCDVCVQPYREGHRNCDCDQNHLDPCTRPTYSELEAKLENSRRIAGDNADLAMRYRNALQALLKRNNLSQQAVAEIETALEPP